MFTGNQPVTPTFFLSQCARVMRYIVHSIRGTLSKNSLQVRAYNTCCLKANDEHRIPFCWRERERERETLSRRAPAGLSPIACPEEGLLCTLSSRLIAVPAHGTSKTSLCRSYANVVGRLNFNHAPEISRLKSKTSQAPSRVSSSHAMRRLLTALGRDQSKLSAFSELEAKTVLKQGMNSGEHPFSNKSRSNSQVIQEYRT